MTFQRKALKKTYKALSPPLKLPSATMQQLQVKEMSNMQSLYVPLGYQKELSYLEAEIHSYS